MKKYIINNLKYIIPLLIFTIYALISYFFNFQACLFKLIIGYPCPGCGMIRAFIFLVSFRFNDAFFYNPFIYVLPLIAIVIIFKNNKYINLLYKSNLFWIILLALFLIIYILRMIFVFPNVPLDINYDSLLFKLISLFK